MNHENNIVLVFKTDGMGMCESQPLKETLARTFLTLAGEMEPLPRIICFYTDGVKLACEDSPVLEILADLEGKGVRLILCQTCLTTLGLSNKVKVGIVGGMGDIISAIWEADKVIAV